MVRLAALVVVATLSLACASAPKPKPASHGGPSPFQAESVEGLGAPEVVIENQSDRDFTIKLTGPSTQELTIPPHEKRSVRLDPGTYAFHASAADIKPLDGEHTFTNDMRYSWAFFIDDKDPDEGKGWFCFSIATTAFVACERTQTACDTRRTEAQKSPGAPKLGSCEPLSTPWAFVHKAKKSEWFGKDEAGCKKAREDYLADDEKPDPLAVSACKPRP